MLLLEINNLKKYFGDRLILSIDRLKIYDNDKIGLIGINGAGKTTFLRIIAGELEPDEGEVKIYCSYEYIKQLDDDGGKERESRLSGGEKTAEKLASAFSGWSGLIMADEPTSNLSISRIEDLSAKLLEYNGGIILISHDRTLLNGICNKMIEISDGRITEYAGNYDFYKKEKDLKEQQLRKEYEKYKEEKEHLEDAVKDIKKKAGSMKKAPSRMGNSEARLHKNSIKAKAKKYGGTSKAIEARLEKLEEEKNQVVLSHYGMSKRVSRETESRSWLELREGGRLYSKNVLEAVGVSAAFGNKVLFENACFNVKTGSKTALIGENGTGKTTLIKMIMNDAPGIKKAQGLKIAYFSQDLSVIDESKSIYENASDGSSLNQTQIRGILSRMLFFKDDVYKKVNVLSGGERVKVALAKIFCLDVNMLILDEPNNYLDIYSLDALEGLLQDYNGTILYATHDRSLISLADNLIIMENTGIIQYDGNYPDYIDAKKSKSSVTRTMQNNLLQMELRLAEIIGRLSVPRKDDDIEALDIEFKELSSEINKLKRRNENKGG